MECWCCCSVSCVENIACCGSFQVSFVILMGSAHKFRHLSQLSLFYRHSCSRNTLGLIQLFEVDVAFYWKTKQKIFNARAATRIWSTFPDDAVLKKVFECSADHRLLLSEKTAAKTVVTCFIGWLKACCTKMIKFFSEKRFTLTSCLI